MDIVMLMNAGAGVVAVFSIGLVVAGIAQIPRVKRWAMKGYNE